MFIQLLYFKILYYLFMKNKSIKIGVIGAGWWATSHHIPTLKRRKEVILDSVCRIGKRKLLDIKDRFGFHFATEDYKELLKRNLDGVIISSPHGMHYIHSKDALESNTNVLIEKPMATKTSEALDLINTANKKNLTILMSHSWNYLKISKLAKEKIKDGCIGKIESIVCNQISGVRELLQGSQWKLSGPEIMYSPQPSTWSDPETAKGGYGLAQMTHSIALVCFITDLIPQRVFSLDTPSEELELYKSITLECESKFVATFTGSSSYLNTYDNCKIIVFGDKGTLVLNIGKEGFDTTNNRLEIYKKDKEKFIFKETNENKFDAFQPTNNFVDIILDPKNINLSKGSLGVKTTQILDASYRSNSSKKLENI